MARRLLSRAAHAAILALLLPGLPSAADDGPAFELVRLADRVSLARPTTPGPEWTNSLVVERADGILIAGAQPTPSSARALLRAVAGDDPSRVRYLVLSHAHAEAWGGASAFPATTVIVTSEVARRRLADDEIDVAAELAVVGVAGVGDFPRPEPSIGLATSATLAASAPGVVVTRFGNAHSPGDLVVEIPELGIAWVGGVLAADGLAPYAGDADMEAWMAGLNRLVRSGLTTFCGLHAGPIDAAELRRRRDAFAWLRAAVDTFVLDRVRVADLAGAVMASPELGTHFDLDREQPFLRGLIDVVVEEAVQQRAKRGLILE